MKIDQSETIWRFAFLNVPEQRRGEPCATLCANWLAQALRGPCACAVSCTRFGGPCARLGFGDLGRTLRALVRDLARAPASSTRCANLVRDPASGTSYGNLVRNPAGGTRSGTTPTWKNIAQAIQVAHDAPEHHKLAPGGIRWHKLAQVGTRWHKVAQGGTRAHKMAQNGTRRHKSA